MTELCAQWAGQPGLDADSHWIKYLGGAIVDRSAAASWTFTVPTPGAIPNIAVVAVPAACDFDNAYDPLFGDPTAANLIALSVPLGELPVAAFADGVLQMEIAA